MIKQKNKAILALENGKIFQGYQFGATGESAGEVVFNTSMTGYQEILTDPSYTGQVVLMTYPLIGNYGVNEEDVESDRLFLQGLVVRQLSGIRSNFRSKLDLNEYLRVNGIVGIEGVDTRALTRRIRNEGAMRCILSTEDRSDEALLAEAKAAPDMVGLDLVERVTGEGCGFFPAPEGDGPTPLHVVALDFGIKRNIVRMLNAYGASVRVVPATTSAEDILAFQPDGLFLSNGPGDPAAVTYAAETVGRLLGKLPIFGICLGHQIMGIVLDGHTVKLKFGHHGANHPVKDLESNRIEITTQNHGFAVDADSLAGTDVQVTHVNLNDGTVEGIAHPGLRAFSVQHHPEAAPGPHDSHHIFERFIDAMRK